MRNTVNHNNIGKWNLRVMVKADCKKKVMAIMGLLTSKNGEKANQDEAIEYIIMNFKTK